MALQIAALRPYVRALPCTTGPLSRVRADFQRAGVKFKHIVAPGSPQLGGKPATSPLRRGHISAALRAEKFSTTALCKSCQGSGPSSPPGRRGWLGKVVFGAALGVSTVTLVQSLHTGTVAAMALKVNLNSAEGDWKETKDFLLSLSVKDRRQYYRTSGSVPLNDIPVWTPTAGGSEPSRYPRNDKLDQKISLYSGDITKLEIDAVVNAVAYQNKSGRRHLRRYQRRSRRPPDYAGQRRLTSASQNQCLQKRGATSSAIGLHRIKDTIAGAGPNLLYRCHSSPMTIVDECRTT
ncbi:O-acetyl-ADP-ribose deacetylase MACROD1 isoform X1 [Lates japonicus]|uniref:O-acetyl-ADP-ribose deacetylase MACROD1 isoform X1 n=1 Tax=Lates japonicus TaxID=270547 RepID=A0AAD3RIX3_LATJO|nr:O-acetyl-ADP-ribose deacetylase MACROD1 isoform X1 [Lates japonicus]